MSEGLTGAYFILMRNCPLLRAGIAQLVKIGNLPYFWICTTLIIIINAYRSSVHSVLGCCHNICGFVARERNAGDNSKDTARTNLVISNRRESKYSILIFSLKPYCK